MQYFFHVIAGAEEFIDQEGSFLDSEELAQAEAREIVRELSIEFPGRFGMGSVLEVMDQRGRRILALPIPA